MAELRTALDGQEGLTYRFGRPSYFSFRTPIEVEIRGFNLRLLERLADDLVPACTQIPGLADIKSSTEGGNPELADPLRSGSPGGSGSEPQRRGPVVRSKVQGTVATDIQREDRKIDIRLRAGRGVPHSVQDLRQLTVHQRGKTAIPLAAVADGAKRSRGRPRSGARKGSGWR